MLSLNWSTILFNIINLIVLYLILRKILFKPVTEIMQKRRQTIEGALTNAQMKEEEAFAMHKQYEEEMKASKGKADDLILNAKSKAQIEYDRIILEAKHEAAKVLETAQSDFELQKKKELEKMQESIVDIAIAIAMKASEESIDEDKSKKLLEELVMKAGA